MFSKCFYFNTKFLKMLERFDVDGNMLVHCVHILMPSML